MTGHIYRDVILEQHVRLFRGTMGAEFLFMDDNARPHRANIVDECLQSGDIPRMDWPAYSPDLNPIEHVWDILGRRIAARQPPPTCLPELRRALFDEWCNIPQDQIDNLILSMPRRLPFHFPKGHNGKVPAGRQPLLEFCLATSYNSGLGNFYLGYLPRPEWQNLNQIKLQPYQEWRDGRKLMKDQTNSLDFAVIMSCTRADMRVEGEKIKENSNTSALGEFQK
ncbi:transposable element Tcb2 transposase [Trichonephila clavipes]|nr:transposable element Tcb2 transposase [Trichonephila clavipes]